MSLRPITVADRRPSLINEFLAARAAGRSDRMNEIRDHAQQSDPDLLAELDCIDYPAAA